MSNNILGQGIARVEVNILDLSTIATAGRKGIAAVAGITERGTPRTPRLIKSWIEFVRYYGGYVADSQFPHLCKRALDSGATLLVSRIAHYSDIADVTTLAGQAATASYTYPLWGVSMKAKDFGAWGNGLTCDIVAAASGLSGKVDIVVRLAGYPQFDYIVPDVNATMTASDIDDFNNRSRFVDIQTTYGALQPASGVAFTLGYEDYTALDENDYLGDVTAQTGLHAFDDSKEHTRIAIFEPTSNLVALHDILIDYCEVNGLMGFYPTPLFGNGWEAVDFRKREGTYTTGTAVPDTWKCRLIYGAIKVKDPRTNLPITISIIADWIGAAARKDNNWKEWFAEAGSKRGVVINNSGIFYNLGTAARKDEADAVDIAGISMAIDHETFGVVCWGNSTLQRADTLLKHANVAELLLYLRRTIKTIVQSELFDPNDTITWKVIYRNVAAFMDYVKAERGVYDYKYDGDQDIDNIADATVNDPMDIAAGVYKFNLFVKPIPAMKYIGVQVVVTNSNVDLNVLANNI